MLVYVDRERCTGCGECVPVCPQKAISLLDGVASIDADLCAQCGACVAACPERAILEAFEDDVALRATIPHGAVRADVPAKRQTGLSPATRKWLPAIGAGLAAMGKYVIPRLAEAIVDSVERRLARDEASGDKVNRSQDVRSERSAVPSGQRAGQSRRRRHRGGRDA